LQISQKANEAPHPLWCGVNEAVTPLIAKYFGFPKYQHVEFVRFSEDFCIYIK